MNIDDELFRIETNHIMPAQGRVLISEPFLSDRMFGRSVVLLVEHTDSSIMGLVLNKPLPFPLNAVLRGLNADGPIPVYQGGPLCTDTLFFLHTLDGVNDSLPISEGIYLNGDFESIKDYISHGNPIDGKIRFFLGYSGWGSDQLDREIKENTWLVGKERVGELMDEASSRTLWYHALCNLGKKYAMWSRFPQFPIMN